MITTLFYPAYLAITFILSLIFIPRKEYKEYLIYGFILGGFGDTVMVAFFQDVLHVMWFKNMGVFNVLGHHFLSPPCWTFTVMLFLHFLPTRPVFKYIYILTFGFYSVGYGLMVRNAALFDFRPWFYPVVSYFTFLAWWCVAAWVFIRTSPLAKNDPVGSSEPPPKQW